MPVWPCTARPNTRLRTSRERDSKTVHCCIELHRSLVLDDAELSADPRDVGGINSVYSATGLAPHRGGFQHAVDDGLLGRFAYRLKQWRQLIISQ